MSEYIPRLREELVGAAARERAGMRHGRRIRPARVALVVAAAAIAAAIVLAATAIDLPNDERPVAPPPVESGLSYRVDPPHAAGAAAAVLRDRIAAAGISGADVAAAGDAITVRVGPADRARVAALAAPGRLAVYDWEGRLVGGAEPTTERVAARRAGEAHGVLVHDEHGWYALAGTAALGNADVAAAHVTTDPTTGEPAVAIDLNAAGMTAFRDLTRQVARRGAANAPPGADPVPSSQHIAIVLDHRLVTLPYINYRENPDGIDGSSGLLIERGLTPQGARDMAAVLTTGPLPAALTPAGGVNP